MKARMMKARGNSGWGMRLSASSQAWQTLLAVTLGAGVGVVAELARVVLKGAHYQLSSFGDAFFYRAMALNFGQQPMSVTQELASIGETAKTEELSSFYGGSGFWSTHVHAENGLSHQLPWALRGLPSAVVHTLTRLGIDIDVGFLIVYVCALILFTGVLFTYLSITVARPVTSWTLTITALIAVVAFTSSGYPDVPYLGFAMWAVLAAYRRNTWGFAIASVLAVLCRETGLLLIFVWVAYCWPDRSWKRSLAILAPVGATLVLRAMVPVPNSSVDYLAMIRMSAGGVWPYLLATTAILSVGLVSPLPMRSTLRRKEGRQWRSELVVWSVAIFWVYGGVALGLAFSRMLLLVLPLLFAPQGWIGTRSKLWLTSAGVALVGYAVADTLAFRANPVLGQWPWLMVAVVVVGLQLLACRHDFWAKKEIERPFHSKHAADPI